eukprot:833178-Rhodomonas_salina.1
MEQASPLTSMNRASQQVAQIPQCARHFTLLALNGTKGVGMEGPHLEMVVLIHSHWQCIANCTKACAC